jgi:hypothetical protein
MAAGVTDHVWTVEEIANLAPIEAPKTRDPYKKRADQDLSCASTHDCGPQAN